MGILTNLVKMKHEQDWQAKQGPLDVARIVLTNPDSTPEAREWAMNSVATLLDNDFSGKKSGGSSGGMGGGAPKPDGVGGFFKGVLGKMVGGFDQVNPYRASKGTRDEVSQVAGARPQKMILSPEEKEGLRAKQAQIESQEALMNAARTKIQTGEINRVGKMREYTTIKKNLMDGGMKESEAVRQATFLSENKVPPAERAASMGTPRMVYGKIKGQEDAGLQQLFINPRDPAAGYMDANGDTYKKEEVSDLSNTPPPQQRLFGRPLEISKYVESKGYPVGSPEYNHWFGVIAGADLRTSLGRTQQLSAQDAAQSGIGLGQGFPPIPDAPAVKPTLTPAAPAVGAPSGLPAIPAAPGAPGASAAPTAAPAKPTLAPKPVVAATPVDDRFISMYLGNLYSDAPASGGAAKVGIIKGREALKKLTGLSAVDFAGLEAMAKEQRKGMGDNLQRMVATNRVNQVIQGFGDEVVKRAKNILNTNSPLLNKPIREIELKTVGDPDLRRFLVALNGFQRQYSILTAGSPQSRAMLPVSVADKVDHIIDPNMTLAEVIANVDQVKREGLIEEGKFKDSLKTSIDAMGSGFKPGGAGTLGERGGTSGKVKMRAPNGAIKEVDPSEVEHYKGLGALVVK